MKIELSGQCLTYSQVQELIKNGIDVHGSLEIDFTKDGNKEVVNPSGTSDNDKSGRYTKMCNTMTNTEMIDLLPGKIIDKFNNDYYFKYNKYEVSYHRIPALDTWGHDFCGYSEVLLRDNLFKTIIKLVEYGMTEQLNNQ